MPDHMLTLAHREELREQHAIGEEIGEAITQGVANQGLDEGELDDELEALQQEELDNKMLKTGTVPVSDQVNRLPTPAQGERELHFYPWKTYDSANEPLQSSDRPDKRKKTTRKRSYGGYKPTWRCDEALLVNAFFFVSYLLGLFAFGRQTVSLAYAFRSRCQSVTRALRLSPRRRVFPKVLNLITFASQVPCSTIAAFCCLRFHP